MSTSTSHAPSNSPSNYASGNQEDGLFSLDFLALAGLDSGMPGDMTSPTNPNIGQQQHQQHRQQQQQQYPQAQRDDQSQPFHQHFQNWDNTHAGPSSQTSSSTVTRNPSTDTETNPRGRNRKSQRGDNENDMDLDQPDFESLGQQEGFSLNGDPGDRGGGGDGSGGGGTGGRDYHALQAALLQQQLQSIHMQSPLGFDINNPQYPLAQMFLSSPGSQMAQLQQMMQNDSGQEGSQHGHRGSIDTNWASGLGGMPTPGSSGELIPQSRQEVMSPIHLEMLARAQAEFGGDPNMLPLLSPALSQSTATSFNSPSTHIAFNSQPSSGHLSAHGSNRSPLEQLQEQQRQFQEQLAVLQQRQMEMQATAAAVAAASSHSPFIGSNPGSSGPTRAATTPGATPNSGFFSPLTSPALEASNRNQMHGHRRHFSPAFNPQQSRTPHPLSALSSPALNPVGSSGGAQQTLSPALGPQTGADLSDPEYLRALVGMLDGNPQGLGDPAQSNYHSPSMTSSSTAGHSTILASPALIPTGTGPHRNSLPTKSRPSPMLKPTGHRSHQRAPSGTLNGNGTFSVPTSPAIQKYHPNPPHMGGMGYLPPSAVDHRNLAPSGTSLSSASTPSPVDLSHIMPPPPVPNGTSKSRKGIAPMTPASLMNLASAAPIMENVKSSTGRREDESDHCQGGRIPPPAPPSDKRGSAGTNGRNTRKQNGTNGNGNSSGGKKAAGSKLVPVGGGTGGGKRALAIRPQGGIASRTATKPTILPPAEPENRKTSHKAAEQKRRDSLKAGFDELRLLLPPINVEALDPESGEPIPGSSAPRLLPKSSLVPDDNPNRGVSKVALLRFGNEYIEKLKERVDRRDTYIERLRGEVKKLRNDETDEDVGEGDEDEDEIEEEGDVLDYDWREGEEDEFDPPLEEDDEQDEEEGEEVNEDVEEDEMDIEDNSNASKKSKSVNGNGRRKSISSQKSPALKATRRPSLIRGLSSSATITSTKKQV
ncbi:uncharacterized protein IL334_003834 [Kwoniella shivajii]|uniref:BHLH domain-containing protein n=1 Tax=Kwoniella shivajii TaxID=564305 RepID=A0ABZ1CZ27_9TREE|nr:hypothetical protein IL334_003834 [Kwoniella shivajii]